MVFFDAHSYPSSLYLHYPICKHVCSYCDFNVFSKAQFDNSYDEVWLDAILRHHRSLSSTKKPLKTFYLGGGTPSLLKLSTLQKLRQEFQYEANAESTIECNPETLTKEHIQGLASLGFNRLSLGVQSFSSHHLKRLERLSTKKHIESVLGWISDSFSNFSIDLMIGVPDQSLEDALKDLQQALEFSPTHLSIYILTVADDHLYKVHPSIKNRLTSDQEVGEIYLEVCKRAKSSGYIHYEVSNFAKEGFESKHNRNYWNTNSSYLALGPGAHGYFSQLQKVRYQNLKDPKAWAVSLNGVESKENLDPSQQDLERFYLKLRSGAPLSPSEIPRSDDLKALEHEGLIEHSSSGLRATERGWLYMEYIAERLLVS